MHQPHSHHHHKKLSGKKLLFSIILNIVITVAQVIGGIISGSLALISDAVHNLSDVISLIISYLANYLTNKKKQTLHYTFGFKRAEIIAAFLNSATLIIIAVFLAIEAVKRFNNPQIIGTDYVIWLALIAILANGLSVLLLKKDANNNLNMRAAYLHLLSDMLTSVAVFIGGFLMKWYEIYWIDALLTLIISVYLLYMSWNIFIDSLKILMLFAPTEIDIKDIVKDLCNLESVKSVHHIHIWQLNDHDTHFEAHVEFEKDIQISQFDKICTEMEIILSEKFHIYHSNLQPEFFRNDSKEIIIQD